MAQTVCVILRADDRERLAAIIGDRSRPLKHVLRARIVFLSAERLPVLEVARRAGVRRPAVWRWQQRYGEEGVDGLLRDKTRPPGKRPLPPATIAKVLALTCSEPPGEATHWTGRAVAKAVGISLQAVQRIWTTHRLQPHRIRTFKRSNDPAFAEKVTDIVGQDRRHNPRQNRPHQCTFRMSQCTSRLLKKPESTPLRRTNEQTGTRSRPFLESIFRRTGRLRIDFARDS
jgi:hypothetical protein